MAVMHFFLFFEKKKTLTDVVAAELYLDLSLLFLFPLAVVPLGFGRTCRTQKFEDILAVIV